MLGYRYLMCLSGLKVSNVGYDFVSLGSFPKEAYKNLFCHSDINKFKDQWGEEEFLILLFFKFGVPYLSVSG